MDVNILRLLFFFCREKGTKNPSTLGCSFRHPVKDQSPLHNNFSNDLLRDPHSYSNQSRSRRTPNDIIIRTIHGYARVYVYVYRAILSNSFARYRTQKKLFARDSWISVSVLIICSLLLAVGERLTYTTRVIQVVILFIIYASEGFFLTAVKFWQTLLWKYVWQLTK